MSNANIIVLDDAGAVPVRALADRLRMHPVDVVKDLRPRLQAGLDPRCIIPTCASNFLHVFLVTA